MTILQRKPKFDKNYWKKFCLPWGVHKGKTMFEIYVKYFSYIIWLVEKCKDKRIQEFAVQAKEYKDRVDPFSSDDFVINSKRK